jgi:hypothetical protein
LAFIPFIELFIKSIISSPYLSSSKINSKLIFYKGFYENQKFLLLGHSLGGGNRGSRQIWNVSSINFGIILAKRGQLVSRQGFVLISMSHGFSSESIIKSIPNSSKLFNFLPASRCIKVDLTA